MTRPQRFLGNNASSSRTLRHRLPLEKQERAPKCSDYYVDRGGTPPITPTCDSNLKKKVKNATRVTDIRANWNNTTEELVKKLIKKSKCGRLVWRRTGYKSHSFVVEGVKSGTNDPVEALRGVKAALCARMKRASPGWPPQATHAPCIYPPRLQSFPFVTTFLRPF